MGAAEPRALPLGLPPDIRASPRGVCRRPGPALQGLLALMICLAVFAWYAAPLIRHLNLPVIGRTSSDSNFYIWSFRWLPYAITHGLNPLYSNQIMAPGGISLAWTTPVPAVVIARPRLALGRPVELADRAQRRTRPAYQLRPSGPGDRLGAVAGRTRREQAGAGRTLDPRGAGPGDDRGRRARVLPGRSAAGGESGRGGHAPGRSVAAVHHRRDIPAVPETGRGRPGRLVSRERRDAVPGLLRVLLPDRGRVHQ